jgi:two-component sensor histidine kinase/ligand-binding sensor domain-containing protein
MYFANNHGVLRFDGAYWDIAPSLNGGLIRSINKDRTGKIYWGGQSDLGYLASDSSGSMQLISLNHLLPDSVRSYHNVWDILPTDEGIYFRTNDYFFRYQNGVMTLLSEGANYRHASLIDGRIVLHQFNKGLLYLDGDTFSFIDGSDALARDLIGGIVPLDNGDWLILTYFEGLFIYNGESFQPIEPPINENLKEALGYKALRLSNGNIAIATIYSGVYIIDQKGQLIVHSNIEEIPATGLYQDDQKGLWVTRNGGITRIEIESPLSVFYKESGIPGTINTVTRHNGELYVGGDNEVYKLETYADRTAEFLPVDGLRVQTWSLLSTPNGLLAGTQNGLFAVNSEKISTISEGLTVRKLKASDFTSDFYFAGTLDGIRTLEFKSGEWLLSNPVEGIDMNVHYIAESPDSVLWLGSHYQGVLRVENFYTAEEPIIQHIDQEDGFPERNDQYTNSFWLDDHIAVGTSRGLYTIDESSMQAIPDTSFGPLFTGIGKDVYRVEQAINGDWFVRSSDNGILQKQNDGSFTWDSLSHKRLKTGSTQDFYFDEDGIVWMVANRGVVRYDSKKNYSYAFELQLNFNKVALISGDSVLFGGSNTSEFSPPELLHTQNALRFQYSLSSYDLPETSEYTYRLKGLDKDWSEWSPETQKDYTNLSHGDYIMEVKGRDLYGNESEVTRFPFSILPPWYLSAGAKSLYVILVSGLIFCVAFMVSKVRTRRLEEQNLQLEAEVKARTSEIEAQKKVIEENLAEKEVLLKEIHHRVKNNLQIIYSLLNLQKESITDEKVLDAIRTGQSRIRSMSMIHEILYQNDDLKRVELAPYLKNLVSHIEQSYKNEEVRTEFKMEPCEVDLNVAIPLGLTVNEVVSNAFKHAFKDRKDGLLNISASIKEGFLRLVIKDNGPGFDPDEASQKQDETLGIMLIKDMIRQLKGTRELITSSGTEYILTIPLTYD